MPLAEIQIAGFKSLRKATWSPGNLNVFIGPNASGKSNVLQALEFLRTSAAGGLSEYVQRNGGIDTLRWDNSAARLAFTLVLDEVPHAELATEYNLTLRSLATWNRYAIEVERLATTGSSTDYPGKPVLDRDSRGIQIYDERTKLMTAVETQRIDTEETIVSVLTPLVNASGSIFKRELQRWTIYTSLNTAPHSAVRQPSLTRRETVVSDTGDNLVSVLHTLYTEDRQFRNELDTAMRAAFNDEFEELIFPPASDQRVQMRVHWRGLKHAQPAGLLSDGTLRFLYLITILANPNPPPLIAIEEPEVGLHPSMLPIIAEYAAQASQRTQVILTTHSADFLDTFRDTGVTPTTTVARRLNGETELRVLSGDELEYWLREYTLGQLFRSSELEQIG